ncbi:molybdate-binding protein [Virgisporangium aliadipatigenens]|uniref:Molybdate-binding protein n=1 Tax=Virgisporangium aliadipatigenens TaxID=741659 RepID=A0A8J3YFF1_9ACTN|nr:molybdate ABC transporter substrate-binding protein [Virgisporangium aliadipatigenens]GIJ44164.1 molybdate-binding protein [Virgisporangium aliadipatigenens]
MRTNPLIAALLGVITLLGLSASAGPLPAVAPATAGHDHHHHPAAPARPGDPNGTVVVHAADELRATLTRLAPIFEDAFPGVRVAVDYGAGARHLEHILAGAPVDVFVSADPAVAARLTGRYLRGAPAVVARDPIVIAVPRAATGIAGVADLSRSRVALCAETTPCGRAGRAALAAAAVDPVPVAVEPDAAAALNRVRDGAADAAVVRRSDVVAAGAELRAVEFPEAARVSDEYTAVKVTTGANTVGADAFCAFLGSALVRRVLADAGLSPDP